MKPLKSRPSNTFYLSVLQKLLASGTISTDSSILVVCGGASDAEVLNIGGFTNVTITNIGGALDAGTYSWAHQDAENLTYGDASFDYVLVHAGLHHCRSPHRGLLEMYRVAKKGVLVFEARNSFALKLAKKLKLVPDFEIEAVVQNGFTSGGVSNSAVPNFIYRWTENEVFQTILSNQPAFRAHIDFFYGFLIPIDRLLMRRNQTAQLVLRPMAWLAQFFFSLFPRQGNQFSFFIRKPVVPADLAEWIKLDGGQLTINREWCRSRFRT